MPTVLVYEITLSEVDEALDHAAHTLTVRKSMDLDVSSTAEWIDTLLDMRHALTA